MAVFLVTKDSILYFRNFIINNNTDIQINQFKKHFVLDKKANNLYLILDVTLFKNCQLEKIKYLLIKHC